MAAHLWMLCCRRSNRAFATTNWRAVYSRSRLRRVYVQGSQAKNTEAIPAGTRHRIRQRQYRGDGRAVQGLKGTIQQRGSGIKLIGCGAAAQYRFRVTPKGWEYKQGFGKNLCKKLAEITGASVRGSDALQDVEIGENPKTYRWGNPNPDHQFLRTLRQLGRAGMGLLSERQGGQVQSAERSMIPVWTLADTKLLSLRTLTRAIGGVVCIKWRSV